MSLSSILTEGVARAQDAFGITIDDENEFMKPVTGAILQDAEQYDRHINAEFAEASASARQSMSLPATDTQGQVNVEKQLQTPEGLGQAITEQSQLQENVDARAMERTAEARARIGQQKIADMDAVQRQNVQTGIGFDQSVAMMEARGRLQQSQFRTEAAQVGHIEAQMVRLKAFERNQNEQKGYIASTTIETGDDMAGETGRRRVRGEAPPTRLSPEKAYDVAKKLNTIEQTGTLPAGQVVRESEINDIRDILNTTKSGRNVLLKHDKQVEEVKQEFDREKLIFETMDDVNAWLEEQSDKPLIADFARIYAAENLDDKDKRIFIKNAAKIDKQAKKKNELAYQQTVIRNESERAYKQHNINPEIPLGVVANILYKQDPNNLGEVVKRSDEEIEAGVLDANRKYYDGVDSEKIGADILAGNKTALERVDIYRKEADGAEITQGDMTGYDFLEEPTEVEIGDFSDSEIDENATIVMNQVLEATGEDFASADDITKYVEDVASKSYGDDPDRNTALKNTVGKRALEMLQEDSRARVQAFEAYQNGKLTQSLTKLRSTYNDIDNMTNANDRINKVVSMMGSSGSFNPTDANLAQVANYGEEGINNLTNNIIAGKLVQDQLPEAERRSIMRQVNKLNINPEDDTVHIDIKRSYNQLRGIVSQATANANNREIERSRALAAKLELKRLEDIAEQNEQKAKAIELSAAELPANITTDDLIPVTYKGGTKTLFATDEETGKWAAWALDNKTDPLAVLVLQDTKTTGGIYQNIQQFKDKTGYKSFDKPNHAIMSADSRAVELYRKTNNNATMVALENNDEAYLNEMNSDTTKQSYLRDAINIANDLGFEEVIKGKTSLESYLDAYENDEGEELQEGYKEAILKFYDETPDIAKYMTSSDPTKRAVGIKLAIINAREEVQDNLSTELNRLQIGSIRIVNELNLMPSVDFHVLKEALALTGYMEKWTPAMFGQTAEEYRNMMKNTPAKDNLLRYVANNLVESEGRGTDKILFAHQLRFQKGAAEKTFKETIKPMAEKYGFDDEDIQQQKKRLTGDILGALRKLEESSNGAIQLPRGDNGEILDELSSYPEDIQTQAEVNVNIRLDMPHLVLYTFGSIIDTAEPLASMAEQEYQDKVIKKFNGDKDRARKVIRNKKARDPEAYNQNIAVLEENIYNRFLAQEARKLEARRITEAQEREMIDELDMQFDME